MKGAEFIFVSIGLTFLLVAVFTFLNGAFLERQANPMGGIILGIAPWLFAVSVLFVGLGFGIALHRRWYGRSETPIDEGPGYP